MKSRLGAEYVRSGWRLGSTPVDPDGGVGKDGRRGGLLVPRGSKMGAEAGAGLAICAVAWELMWAGCLRTTGLSC